MVCALGLVAAVGGCGGDERVARTATPSATEGVVFVESSRALALAEGRTDIWGVAVSDWNGDGCDDLYVGRHRGAEPHLYANGCPGPFVDEFARLPIPRDPRQTKDKHAVAFADYDGDGRPDLFVATGGGHGTGPGDDDQLYHQLPDGTFEDVAPAEGMTDQPASGRFGLWFDYDGDADLDLFVGHLSRSSRREENRNILWRNTGGRFADVARAARVDAAETSKSGVATDLDRDGDVDLITVPGDGASLYTNRGDGTFDRRSWRIDAASSVAAADYDNDCDTDLLFSRAGGGSSRLLRNDDGRWRDVTRQSRAGFRNGGAAVWVDVNSDGWLDLFLVRQSRDDPSLQNALLVNRGDGTFADVSAAAGVTGPTDAQAERKGAAWGDFDRDGRVDLAVVTPFSARPVSLYLNRTSGSRHWVTLRLRDPGTANRDALGAQVQVTAGGHQQCREVIAATAAWSQSPPYLVIGLGSTTRIDSLRIRWPDSTVSSFRDLAVDRHYLATKGARLISPL